MKAGWIGTGNMGVRMAERLVKAGYDLYVYNRTPQKAQRVLDAAGAENAGSATLLQSPSEIAQNSDIIFISVTNENALSDILESENGLLSQVHPGQIIVEMSTLDPEYSNNLHESLCEKGLLYLNAPVIGSMHMIEAGLLKILASGDQAAYDAAMPYFEAIGKTSIYMGSKAQARHMKIAVNMMICSYLTIYGEVLCAGEGMGFEWDELNDLLENSEGASSILFDKGTTLRARIWEGETALTSTAMKDLKLALSCAEKGGFTIPLTALLCQYDRFMYSNPRYSAYSTFGTIGMLEDQAGKKPGDYPPVAADKKKMLSTALVNTLLGTTTVLASEAVNFCRKSDIDIKYAAKCLESCHGATRYFSQLHPDARGITTANDEHTISEIQNDMRTVLEHTRGSGLFLPIIAISRQKLNLYSYNEKLSDILK